MCVNGQSRSLRIIPHVIWSSGPPAAMGAMPIFKDRSHPNSNFASPREIWLHSTSALFLRRVDQLFGARLLFRRQLFVERLEKELRVGVAVRGGKRHPLIRL